MRDAGEAQDVLQYRRVLHDGDGGGEEVAEEVDEAEDLQGQAHEGPSVGLGVGVGVCVFFVGW